MCADLHDLRPEWVRACRFDGWMATSHPEQDIYPLIDNLNRVREETGTAGKPFDIWTGVINPDEGAHARLAEAGVTDLSEYSYVEDAELQTDIFLDE